MEVLTENNYPTNVGYYIQDYGPWYKEVREGQ